jgi:hypothetical protein
MATSHAHAWYVWCCVGCMCSAGVQRACRLDAGSAVHHCQQRALLGSMTSMTSASLPFLSVPALAQPCPENTVTSDQFVAPATTGNPPYTSADSCLCRPGWGWYNKVASICAVGYWKGGYNNMDCAACGAGLTTATPGADDASLCVPLPGWAKDSPRDDFASPWCAADACARASNYTCAGKGHHAGCLRTASACRAACKPLAHCLPCCMCALQQRWLLEPRW